jgi:hypothetical protein
MVVRSSNDLCRLPFRSNHKLLLEVPNKLDLAAVRCAILSEIIDDTLPRLGLQQLGIDPPAANQCDIASAIRMPSRVVLLRRRLLKYSLPERPFAWPGAGQRGNTRTITVAVLGHLCHC